MVAKSSDIVGIAAKQVATATLASESKRLRATISMELHDQAAKLRSKPIPGRIKDLALRSSIVETITRTAGRVYGWDNQDEGSRVVVFGLIQSGPCGVENTSGVLTQEPVKQIAQAAQVVDVESV